MTMDLRLELDQHRNVITSRRSSLAHVYHVWSTSINAFVSYLAEDRRAHRHTGWSQYLLHLYRGACN